MATRSFDRDYALKATEENIELFKKINELEHKVFVVEIEHDDFDEILRVIVPKRDR